MSPLKIQSQMEGEFITSRRRILLLATAREFTPIGGDRGRDHVVSPNVTFYRLFGDGLIWIEDVCYLIGVRFDLGFSMLSVLVGPFFGGSDRFPSLRPKVQIPAFRHRAGGPVVFCSYRPPLVAGSSMLLLFLVCRPPELLALRALTFVGLLRFCGIPLPLPLPLLVYVLHAVYLNPLMS